MDKVSRKDNPHKPNTEEWKKWNHDNLWETKGQFVLIKDVDFAESKKAAHARMKSLQEVYDQRTEQQVKYQKTLDFIEKDTEPEFDPVLDCKQIQSLSDLISSFDKMLGRSTSTIWQTHAFFDRYPRVPNDVFLASAPSWAKAYDLERKRLELLSTELPKEYFYRGFVDVPVHKRVPYSLMNNPLVAANVDDTFGIARFHII